MHHAKADAGTITRPELYKAKERPYSRTVVGESDFRIPSTVASVKLGSNTFIDTPRLVVVDDLDIVAVTHEQDHPLLNVVIIDQYNNWIGIVEENEWVFDRRALWDIDYTPRHLTIRSRPNHVSFQLKITNDEIFVRGELYYNGIPILISEDAVTFGGRRHFTVSGSTFKNVGTAVSIHTR
jgi:hypothetical protein